MGWRSQASISSKSDRPFATCVSIAEPTPRRMASSLRRALARSEYAELRLDHLRAADVPAALDLASPHMGRCVCTLRPRGEGGRFDGPEAERISTLKLAAEYSPMLLDVELRTLARRPALRAYLRRAGARVLVSWHDFASTPPAGALRLRLAAMSRHSGHAKIVTTARSAADPARVLSLYASAGSTRLVAFCMGEAGRASRVLCLALGSPFTYASLGAPVAPGQMGIGELRRLLPPRGPGTL